jgi:hypothetical protein
MVLEELYGVVGVRDWKEFFIRYIAPVEVNIKILKMVDQGIITGTTAREVFKECVEDRKRIVSEFLKTH